MNSPIMRDSQFKLNAQNNIILYQHKQHVMKTFHIDLSNQEFPISEKVLAIKIRHTIINLKKLEKKPAVKFGNKRFSDINKLPL